jgi:hypothetical protein
MFQTYSKGLYKVIRTINQMEVMIMPLTAISRVEPVTAPTALNTYSPDENSPFFHNFTGNPKQNQPNHNKTKNQIVIMERSVQVHLGKNFNLYV